jgi:3-methyladenine DNA glycosylase AlkD
LAALVAEPEKMTGALVDHWLGDVASWDLCDHLCTNLLIDLPFAARRIPAWAKDEREFVRRAAFALMNSLSIHRAEVAKEMVGQNLKLIREYAHDPRNYVKKAVSWALREIGKRDKDYGMLDAAIALASELSRSKNGAERWVGRDALKELETLVAVPGRKRLVSSGTKRGREVAKRKK